MPAKKKGAASPTKSDRSRGKSVGSVSSGKKKQPAAEKKEKKVVEKKPAAKPAPPTALTQIDMTGVKYPLKEIFMRFL